jgi:hypothetical protein
MRTAYGTWTFDGLLFNPGSGDGEQNGAFQLKLNGKLTARALSIYVACGGNFFFMDTDQNIWAFTANAPYSRIIASPLSAFPTCGSISPALDPLPSVPPTGFTPSANGTTFTCPSAGTATSVDGVWTCGPVCTVDCHTGTNYDMLLNGLRADGLDGVQLEINDGQAFVQHAGGNVNVYLNYQAVTGSPSLAPGPIVINSVNNVNPALATSCCSPNPGEVSTRSIPGLLYTTTIFTCPTDPCSGGATVAATPAVTMSNGSGFTGTWSVFDLFTNSCGNGGPNIFRMSTSGPLAGNLVFTRTLTISDANVAFVCLVQPTENGSAYATEAGVYFNMVVH